MILTFSPQVREDILTVTKFGEVLTINGESFDFAQLPNDATLPCEAIESAYIIGDVERNADGELTVPMLLPIAADASEAARFPEPMTIETDGPITLPR